MSKERLEEIIDGMPYSIRYSGELEPIIGYAKEQVERVQELEKANKNNYWIVSDFKYENLVLEQQNKRYREAIIEALHGLKTLPSVAPRLYLISILDKALEGEE